MRKKEAGAEKEWSVMLSLQLGDGPGRKSEITFVFIAMRKSAPVNKRVTGRRFDERHWWSWTNLRAGSHHIKLGIFLLSAISTVIDLAGHQSFVALLAKELGKCC